MASRHAPELRSARLAPPAATVVEAIAEGRVRSPFVRSATTARAMRPSVPSRLSQQTRPRSSICHREERCKVRKTPPLPICCAKSRASAGPCCRRSGPDQHPHPSRHPPEEICNEHSSLEPHASGSRRCTRGSDRTHSRLLASVRASSQDCSQACIARRCRPGAHDKPAPQRSRASSASIAHR